MDVISLQLTYSMSENSFLLIYVFCKSIVILVYILILENIVFRVYKIFKHSKQDPQHNMVLKYIRILPVETDLCIDSL